VDSSHRKRRGPRHGKRRRRAAPPYWSSSLPRYSRSIPSKAVHGAIVRDRDAVLQRHSSFVSGVGTTFRSRITCTRTTGQYLRTVRTSSSLGQRRRVPDVPINDLVGLPVSTTGWQVYSQSHLPRRHTALQFWSDTYSPGGQITLPLGSLWMRQRAGARRCNDCAAAGRCPDWSRRAAPKFRIVAFFAVLSRRDRSQK